MQGEDQVYPGSRIYAQEGINDMIKKLLIRLYIIVVAALAITYVGLSVFTVYQKKVALVDYADEEVRSMTSRYGMPQRAGRLVDENGEFIDQLFWYVTTWDESQQASVVTPFFDLDESIQQEIIEWIANYGDMHFTGIGPDLIQGFVEMVKPNTYVVLDEKGKAVIAGAPDVDVGISESSASKLWKEGKEFGWKDEYRYHMQQKDNYAILTCLDCSDTIEKTEADIRDEILYNVLKFTAMVALFGVLFIVFARMFVDSYSKHRQFITNASHDLKTPLTLLKTNLSILAYENGENEHIEALMRETDEMAGKINVLVRKSKMDEEA